MTVQELINILNEVENKNIPVVVYNEFRELVYAESALPQKQVRVYNSFNDDTEEITCVVIEGD